MATTFTHDGNGLFSLEGLTTSESSEAIESRNGGHLAGAVHVIDGGGTGFNSGTATFEASLDGTNWFGSKDVCGTAITFTADAYFEFCLAARYVRVTNDASVSDVDVAIFLT